MAKRVTGVRGKEGGRGCGERSGDQSGRREGGRSGGGEGKMSWREEAKKAKGEWIEGRVRKRREFESEKASDFESK